MTSQEYWYIMRVLYRIYSLSEGWSVRQSWLTAYEVMKTTILPATEAERDGILRQLELTLKAVNIHWPRV